MYWYFKHVDANCLVAACSKHLMYQHLGYRGLSISSMQPALHKQGASIDLPVLHTVPDCIYIWVGVHIYIIIQCSIVCA